MHNVQMTRPEKGNFHSAFAAIGHKTMTLGLFMVLQGPYQTPQVLDVMTGFAQVVVGSFHRYGM